MGVPRASSRSPMPSTPYMDANPTGLQAAASCWGGRSGPGHGVLRSHAPIAVSRPSREARSHRGILMRCEERGAHPRVELATRCPPDLFDGLLQWPRGLVWPIVGQRVEHIGYGNHAPDDGD